VKYIELSIESSKKICKDLAKKVSEDKQIDLVIFIAKGGFLMGKYISEYFSCPLIEINATRSGNKIKEKIKKLLTKLPKSIKKILRTFELKSNVHAQKIERNISIDDEIWKKYKKSKNILIVDDAVDTGNSMKQVYNYVETYFNDSKIYTAVINCSNMENTIFNVDYKIYENYIVGGPWSNDSDEKKVFDKQYEEWHESQNKK